ncbi:MAG TPA: hypothetical protein DEP84_13230 [Chloroflexi bacterium]|nr:hypothetical protein [Chloroflexota bacterium]
MTGTFQASRARARAVGIVRVAQEECSQQFGREEVFLPFAEALVDLMQAEASDQSTARRVCNVIHVGDPYTGYRVAQRPPEETQMCILVANPDHSVRLGMGNCFDLP